MKVKSKENGNKKEKKTFSFRKLMKVFFIILPWVAVISLLVTPIPSVKLNNLLRNKEYYELKTYADQKLYKYNVDDLVTKKSDPKLSDLEISKKHVVTDEDVYEEIDHELENYSDTTELEKGMTVESGMNVNIDYEGLIEGEPFEGGSEEGLDLTLGSGTLVDGLEQEIEGHAVGETFKVSIKLPKDEDDSIGDKIAAYTVTINSASIDTQLDHESITDEFVKNNLSGYNSVEEYFAGVRKEVEDYYALEYESSKKSAVLEALKETCDVTIPDELHDQEMEIYKQQFARMYCDEGQTLEEYLSSYYSMTLDDFYKTVDPDVTKSIQNVVLCQKYAEDLGIKINEDDIKAYADDLSQGTSYSSSDISEIYDMYTSDYMSGKDYISRMTLCDKVVQHFTKEATFVETNEESSDESVED